MAKFELLIVCFHSLHLVLINITKSDGQQQNVSIKCKQRDYKTNASKIVSRTDELAT
jgi:hypothetical protein